ncbi:J domain-containing protein [Geitlerinema sp. PCC 9228]|uniref:J domain-containing protein n=1 Tax=Geitlerinema sp. PCC 9228 TaxID=111611 RepID=UPI0008F99D5B|nr:J domain-containing protein [Geitlerinema sp. PCC 9228]
MKHNNKLKLDELKKAIYNYFDVKNTEELRKSKHFQMATDGMEKLNLKKKESWEILYRKFIGILPNEQNEEGYGCINGIDIFKYSRPWQVFGLDPKTSSVEDVKRAYYKLSKIYHPDKETGDRAIFERLEKMYRSLVEGIK